MPKAKEEKGGQSKNKGKESTSSQSADMKTGTSAKQGKEGKGK